MFTTRRANTEAQPSTRRPGRVKARVAASLTLALVAIPAAALPAHAGFPTQATKAPCTVTAHTPDTVPGFHLWPIVKKKVKYPFTIKCTEGGITVHVEQQLREADPGKDDYQRNYFTPNNTPVVFLRKDSQTVETVYPLENLDTVGNEEVYHKVRFRIKTANGQTEWVYVQSKEYSVAATDILP